MVPSASSVTAPRELLQQIVNAESVRSQRLRLKAQASLICEPGSWLREWFCAQPEHEHELTRLLSRDPLFVFETRYPERPLVDKAGASPLEAIFSPLRLESALRGLAEGAALAPQRLAPLLVHVPALCQRLAFASPSGLSDSLRSDVVASYGRLQDARFPPQVSLVPSYACSRRCSYCFVPTSNGAALDSASPASMLQALDVIARDNEVRKVAIFGGEPTELPTLFEFVDGIRRRGLNVYLATNGLAKPEEFQRLVAIPELEMVTVHVMHDEAYSVEQLYKIRTNIRTLASADVQPIVRFNLLPTVGSLDLLKWSLSKLSRAHLSIAVPFPDRFRQNAHVDSEQLFGLGNHLLNFICGVVKWLGRRRIVLAKPFPPCALQPTDLMALLEYCEFRCICELGRGRFPSQITVQPNLSVAPCMAMLAPERLVKGPLPLMQLQREIETRTRDLFAKSLSRRCDGCTLHTGGICQGGCYAYVQ